MHHSESRELARHGFVEMRRAEGGRVHDPAASAEGAQTVGVFGEAHVNVLALNLALDAAAK